MSKAGLGRGLSSLISDKNLQPQPVAQPNVANNSAPVAEVQAVKENHNVTADVATNSLFYPNIESIISGRYQPRTHFKQEELQELSESIKANGVVQPVLIRRIEGKENSFELIAGERRWRASKMAGLNVIPAVLMEISDKKAMEVGLIENVQRQDLNILEEAAGYKRLMSEFEYTQEELSHAIGKSRSNIANTMRLLSLPDGVKGFVEQDKISAGHARCLLTMDDPEKIASEIIKKGLSVRQTEQWVKKIAEQGAQAATPKPVGKSPEVKQLEKELGDKLGMNVSISVAKDKGSVKIAYNNIGQLNMLLDKLEA